jgi:hypothetical protein
MGPGAAPAMAAACLRLLPMVSESATVEVQQEAEQGMIVLVEY